MQPDRTSWTPEGFIPVSQLDVHGGKKPVKRTGGLVPFGCMLTDQNRREKLLYSRLFVGLSSHMLLKLYVLLYS